MRRSDSEECKSKSCSFHILTPEFCVLFSSMERYHMRIIIGCDHGGFDLKEKISIHLRAIGWEAEDAGTFSPDPVDYPYYAMKVARLIAAGEIDRGILICGTGIGMCMTANRISGVRAARVSEPFGAKISRRHYDSNVLCLGGRITGVDMAFEIVETWLREPFTGGRHRKEIELIENLTGTRQEYPAQ